MEFTPPLYHFIEKKKFFNYNVENIFNIIDEQLKKVI